MRPLKDLLFVEKTRLTHPRFAWCLDHHSHARISHRTGVKDKVIHFLIGKLRGFAYRTRLEYFIHYPLTVFKFVADKFHHLPLPGFYSACGHCRVKSMV